MLLTSKTAFFFSLILGIGAGSAHAYSGGPPTGKAGEPGGSDCTDCHAGTLNSGPGTMEFIAPEFYDLGETYTIELRLGEAGAKRWGFEVVAFDATDSPVGSVTITDAEHTQVQLNYVMQTQSGSYQGVGNGPVSWSFDWTAPAEDVGPVTFYYVGNAANNDGTTGGDHIYGDSVVVDAPVAVQSMSWSALKR